MYLWYNCLTEDKVSSHFEYHNNWPCAFDITWQPIVCLFFEDISWFLKIKTTLFMHSVCFWPFKWFYDSFHFIYCISRKILPSSIIKTFKSKHELHKVKFEVILKKFQNKCLLVDSIQERERESRLIDCSPRILMDFTDFFFFYHIF